MIFCNKSAKISSKRVFTFTNIFLDIWHKKNYEKLLTELMKKNSPKQIGKTFIFI